MKLVIFNGSPRGKKSNTQGLLDHLIDGFEATPGNSHELFYLNRVKQTDRFVQAFAEAEVVLLAHPLYTDAMPGMVMNFIEALAPLCGREGNPDIGFVIQNGFGEFAHLRCARRYHEKLAARLGCKYIGTIAKAGCHMVQDQPKMYAKVFTAFNHLGKGLGETGQFDEQILAKLAQPEKFSLPMRLLFQWIWKMQINKGTSPWDAQLEENGVYEQRFARPFVE